MAEDTLRERLEPVWEAAAKQMKKPAPTDEEIKAWLRHEE